MSHNPSYPPLVSVVTPAYNEEEYLAECVESVLAQSYPYWDYCIVDNCSTDRTLAIARAFSVRDPRIRVVSNSNLIAATANFNCALRQISPECRYCKILFADDWMFPDCLQRMVSLMEANPSVGITGAYGLQGRWILWQGVPYETKVVPGREICRQRLLGGPYVFGSATSVLYRADLVRSRDPFYDESISNASDSDVCFELLKACDFGFVHQVLSFSRIREGSLLEMSKDLNASAADLLRELVVYGSHYLTPEEVKQRLGEVTFKYYDFLAANLGKRRGDRFWNYHKEKMRENRIGFSRLALAAAVWQKIANRFRVRHVEGHHRWGL